ncbi:ATP-dependent RNA helicase DEAH11, chloroplastic [Colletotrichum spaethianum]|uniref:RBR-type E3 ubiquitin transferase n=1 Tax=Colletotrichum spaethianum TaxID=700344 RepID=A0AA37LH40_9PEZI|nr:ATP-dependent RNA helicase DEAH11, chloroplastic [Colletotrichum spaethianum]GKT47379.1 ATP-dependent RNA helicase DEAH11, chloroplastic [Colletotrichum spaethianum]
MSLSFFSGMDAETRQLFLKLQQEDVREVHTDRTGGENTRTLSDSQLAFQLYESELKSISTYFSDHTTTRRHGQRRSIGVASVGHPVDQELAVTPGLNNKRKFQEMDDIRISIEDLEIPPFELRSESQSVNNRVVIDLTAQDSPSPSGVSQPDVSWGFEELQEDEHVCVACLVGLAEADTFHALCDHKYCHGCLGELFEASLTSEYQFPPKCCGDPIPIDLDQDGIPADLMNKVKDKVIELSTPNRTYCRLSLCSTFIPKESIKDDVATCPSCMTTTCTICKGAEHADYACEEDEATQEVLKLAEKNSWKRCPTCRALVERNEGCLHMNHIMFTYSPLVACRCGAQFCYRCGVEWADSHVCP